MVDRGTQVEQLIGRYGLVTVAGLCASIFQGLSGKAAERVLTDLLSQERIRSQTLVGRRSFYTLTPVAARAHGLDADRCHFGMGAQAILQHYAIMAFCLLMNPRHDRLTRQELSVQWKHVLGEPFIGRSHRTLYYLDKTDRDTAGVVRLARLVPDLGGHPRRIVRKTRRYVEKCRENSPAAARLIQERLLSVTVLTGFEAKAYQLRSALAREAFHSRVVVVPGYDELLLANGGSKR